MSHMYCILVQTAPHIQHSNAQAFIHEEINTGAFSHVCVVPIFMGPYKHTVIVLIQMVQLVDGLKAL